ncbi:DUF7619 domain-containing protein [Flavobacterium sp.]|uniref:DUF7619 domain-containing protein n=1 Tax=Flavobacterium sp. TaxID=239 RepID=UPI002FD8C550
MKKLLLIIALFFSTSILLAQSPNQPSQFNTVCDENNDGIALFYMQEIAAEITANNQNLVVTHHLTQADAANNVNPLPNDYTNTSNPQLIFARVLNTVTNQVQITTYYLTVSQPTIGNTFTLTNCQSVSGFSCWDLNSMGSQIGQGESGASITYFVTQADAMANTNVINEPSCYISAIAEPNQPPVFYRIDHLFSGQCPTIGMVELVTIDCSITCPAPTAVVATNITGTSAVISWTATGNETSWFINLALNGTPATTLVTSQNPYVLTGLNCGAVYTVTITSICTVGQNASTTPYTFSTQACIPYAGQPTNLSQCSDNGTACFNLTANTPLILNTLNPADYTVTYYVSQTNADAGVSPIIPESNFCGPNGQIIYARLENTATQEYQVFSFALITETITDPVITLSNMDQCDDNNDSVITFNLTTIEAQINTANSLEYYTALSNAQNQVVPITNPSNFTVGVQSPITYIYVREIVPNACDIIYTFQARAYAICNLAYTCPQANSLCNALGVPFANTHQGIQAEAGNNYGCLGSQPNPTWFYLPVSGNGVINLKIEQNTSIAFTGNQLDVDYIVYGPFTNPVTPCSGQLTQNTVVSCSFSPAAIELPVIPNAQTGQYYIIMVTNYSGQDGFIRISELSNTVGAIDCSGFRLNAFLDANNNGTQDNNEQNFPLGHFTYEVNNNGNVHNIISPNGVYNIYDTNAANSYDITYAVDASYAALYNVSPASYTNVNVVIGGGMAVYNFPVTVVQAYNDLAVTIAPISAPRPGFTYQNKIIYTNNGNQTIASGTVTFNKDALVTITGNTQTGTTPTANGFTYVFSSLLPFESRSMTVTMQVPSLPMVAIGGLLTTTATIAPIAGDVVPANNSASNSQIIIGAYDPNDKMESHGERIQYSAFTSNDYLYYTLRFENTGTASAINVRVDDVLDAKLDETTVKMVSASNPYVMDRVGNNLTWKFDNIQLPPSVANTSTGKGYIMFSVKPKPGYAVGDIIPNTAAIYFDFNPAIVTNTFNTEFVAQLGLNEFENGDFIFYPNPVRDIVTVALKNDGSIANIAVYDVLGKLILNQKPNSGAASQTVDLSTISKGVYLLEVTTDTNLKVVKKLIVD